MTNIDKKKSISTKNIGLATMLASVATGAYFILSSGKYTSIPVPAYTAKRVIDGDTFETTEKQIIRLASTEAPELEHCGGTEAKKALEEQILGKPLYLKIVYQDTYHRMVSFVYTSNTFVNKEMIEKGFSYYYRGSPGEIGEQLKMAAESAHKKNIGIYSPTCTQTTNPKKPLCNIKGNTRNGNIYYLPECGIYPNVQVQLYLGDQWFCTETEAQTAGYRKPSQCP